MSGPAHTFACALFAASVVHLGGLPAARADLPASVLDPPPLARDNPGPDPRVANLVRLDWRMLTAAILGGRNNGFTLTCGEAGVSSLTMNVKSETGGAVIASTAVPCPREQSGGELELKLPGKGPYTVFATVRGKPKLASEKVHHVTPGMWITVRVYANGCDEACNR